MLLIMAATQESSHNRRMSSTDADATAAEVPLVGAAASSSANSIVKPPTSMLRVFPAHRSQSESVSLHRQMQACKGIEPMMPFTFEQQIGLRRFGAHSSNRQTVASDPRRSASQEFWQEHQQHFTGEGLSGVELDKASQASVHSAVSFFQDQFCIHRPASRTTNGSAAR